MWGVKFIYLLVSYDESEVFVITIISKLKNKQALTDFYYVQAISATYVGIMMPSLYTTVLPPLVSGYWFLCYYLVCEWNNINFCEIYEAMLTINEKYDHT